MLVMPHIAHFRVISLLLIVCLSSTVLAIQNATNHDLSPNCNQRFTRANITWTNPNLNTNFGGAYNRIGLTTAATANPNQRASAFVEVGWAKNIWNAGLSQNQEIRIQYTDPNGNVQTYVIQRPQRSVHDVAIQYDPLIHKKWFFYENGQGVTNQGFISNFDKACAIVAGGEVFSNVEDMGNTRFSNLQRGWVGSNGIGHPTLWRANTTRLHQGRYRCTVVSVTEHVCGP